MPIKALALLSGGLDSLLAAKLIQNQGVKVTGLSFKSYFFSPHVPHLPQIPLIISDFSSSHLQIVLKPKYGYGKNMNPCLDCHLLMLKEAKKIMWAKGPSSSGRKKYDFLVTGEVLAQRPFSQNLHSLNLLEKESGLAGLIVRPLSGKLLPVTIPEQKGFLDRNKLLNIQGRSRKIQLQLAKQYGLTGYSAPGTSCILTDPGFSLRFKQLLKLNPQPKANDLQLLKLGRHYLKNNCLIIVGRNHQENLALIKLKQQNDVLLELKSLPGPMVLIRPFSKNGIAQFTCPSGRWVVRSPTRSPIINYAKQLLLSHSRYTRNKKNSSNDFIIS